MTFRATGIESCPAETKGSRKKIHRHDTRWNITAIRGVLVVYNQAVKNAFQLKIR